MTSSEREIDHYLGMVFPKGGEQGLKAENSEGNCGVDPDRPAGGGRALRNATFDAIKLGQQRNALLMVHPSLGRQR